MTEQQEAIKALVKWSEHTAQLSATMQGVVAEFHSEMQHSRRRIAVLEVLVPTSFALGMLVGWLL